MKGISWGHRETRCQAEGTGGWGHADPVSELASENRWRHGPCPCPQNGLHALAEQGPQPGMLLPASQRLLVPAPPAKDSRCVRREGSGPNARGPWRPGQCWPVPGAEGQGGTRRPPPREITLKQETLVFPPFPRKTRAGAGPVKRVLGEGGVLRRQARTASAGTTRASPARAGVTVRPRLKVRRPGGAPSFPAHRKGRLAPHSGLESTPGPAPSAVDSFVWFLPPPF